MKSRDLSFALLSICCSVQLGTAQPDNERVTDNSYDQSETAIAISPLHPNLLLASWNDFRPTQFASSGPKPGFAFSTDGGNNWFGGIIEQTTQSYPLGVDPSVAFDRRGQAFYCVIWQ